MFSTHTVYLLNQYIDMKPKNCFNNSSYIDCCFSKENDINYINNQGQNINQQIDIKELIHLKAFVNLATQTKKRKYAAISASEVSTEQDHMTSSKKQKLQKLLKEFNAVFDGKHGLYPHKQIHLDLKITDSTVVHKNEEVFKDKLEHLCNKEVLKKAEPSTWGSPTMIISKKMVPYN